MSSLDEFLEESPKAQSESQEPMATGQPLEPSLVQRSSNALLKELTSKKGEQESVFPLERGTKPDQESRKT